MIRCATAPTFGASNGTRPVAANVTVHPQANMSAGGPAFAPASCSGAMNAGVPTTRLVTVVSASIARAIPKSITRGPSGPSITFPGFTSRCTTPAA
jgi:hypothetical protein